MRAYGSTVPSGADPNTSHDQGASLPFCRAQNSAFEPFSQTVQTGGERLRPAAGRDSGGHWEAAVEEETNQYRDHASRGALQREDLPQEDGERAWQDVGWNGQAQSGKGRPTARLDPSRFADPERLVPPMSQRSPQQRTNGPRKGNWVPLSESRGQLQGMQEEAFTRPPSKAPCPQTFEDASTDGGGAQAVLAGGSHELSFGSRPFNHSKKGLKVTHRPAPVRLRRPSDVRNAASSLETEPKSEQQLSQNDSPLRGQQANGEEGTETPASTASYDVASALMPGAPGEHPTRMPPLDVAEFIPAANELTFSPTGKQKLVRQALGVSREESCPTCKEKHRQRPACGFGNQFDPTSERNSGSENRAFQKERKRLWSAFPEMPHPTQAKAIGTTVEGRPFKRVHLGEQVMMECLLSDRGASPARVPLRSAGQTAERSAFTVVQKGDWEPVAEFRLEASSSGVRTGAEERKESLGERRLPIRPTPSRGGGRGPRLPGGQLAAMVSAP